MTDVDMLKGFLAGAHVDDAVFALRPDYRAMLLGSADRKVTSAVSARVPTTGSPSSPASAKCPSLTRLREGNGAAIIGAHRVLDQPLRDLGQFDVFGLTGLPEPGEGLVRCR
jgi:hypothetical protein